MLTNPAICPVEAEPRETPNDKTISKASPITIRVTVRTGFALRVDAALVFLIGLELDPSRVPAVPALRATEVSSDCTYILFFPWRFRLFFDFIIGHVGIC